MSDSRDLNKNFIIDAQRILDRLNTQLTNVDISIPNIYREIHSLKSAAGFAGLYQMEKVAHNLESFLSSVRNGEASFDDKIEKVLFLSQDYFIKDLNSWKLENSEIDAKSLLSEIENESIVIKPISIEVVNENPDKKSFFTPFEMILLKEAMYRGEQFYRIVCHIDQEEEMKYPRLFLVVNNLEKVCNVVKVFPTMEQIVNNKDKEITLYLTTDKNKSFIYNELSFDRIKEVEVLRLDYQGFFDNTFEQTSKRENTLYGKIIDVETTKLEEIFNYSLDLQNKLLYENIVSPDKKEVIEELISGLKNSIISLTTITVNKAFSFFNQYTEKMGRDLGKKVNFKIIGGDISIERKVAEILKEMIMQLIKNSIDHGIENPEERTALGKPIFGNITLTANRIKDSIAITIEDDGRGIDQNLVVQKGIKENYIEKNDDISLLSLISRSGFTTAKEISYYSGRGVGLDIVVNRVIDKLDGKIKIENRKGEGLSFHILIPPSTSLKKYTVFKYRNRSYGLSDINVIKRVSLDPEAVKKGESSKLNYIYNNVPYPIFTPWGRLSSSSEKLNEKFGFILRYLGKKAFFPVDEFILEKEYFSSALTYLDTDSPSHKMIKYGDKLEDFTLIMPSIINA